MSKIVAKFEKVSFDEFASKAGVPELVTDVTNLREEYDNLQLPKRSTKQSAGYDFFAPMNVMVPAKSAVVIPTGIKCKIDEGFVLKLYPRSSYGFKYLARLANTVGIIDGDYYNNPDNEGHIMVKIFNPKDKPFYISEGTKFVQGLFSEFFLAEEDEVTATRTGGLGSTDKENAGENANE